MAGPKKEGHLMQFQNAQTTPLWKISEIEQYQHSETALEVFTFLLPYITCRDRYEHFL